MSFWNRLTAFFRRRPKDEKIPRQRATKQAIEEIYALADRGYTIEQIAARTRLKPDILPYHLKKWRAKKAAEIERLGAKGGEE